MFQHYDFDNEQDISLLVHQFEEMRENNSIGYFEVSSFLMLLDYYEDNFQMNLVQEVLEHALHQHPNAAALLLRKAEQLFTNEHTDQALECLEQAELCDAGEMDIYLLRSEILTWKQDYNAAHEALNVALSYANDADRYDIFLHRSNIFEDAGDFDNMFKALKAALKINPTGEEALDRMWLTVELSEKYDESIALHNRILDLDAYSFLAWFNLGHAHFCKKEFEKAFEAFEFAYTINEQFEAAYRDAGEALFELERYQDAIEVYQKAIENTRPDVGLFLRIGLCYEQLEEFNTARDFYLKAARLDSQNPETFYRMGECYAQEGRWLSALGAYKKAYKLDETNAEFLATLGEAYFQLEQYDKAKDAFVKAVALEAENPDIWVQYVSFLIDMETYAEAFDALDEAVSNCPENMDLTLCRVACLYESGSKKAALDELAVVLQENPKVFDDLFELFPYLKDEGAIWRIIQLYQSDKSN